MISSIHEFNQLMYQEHLEEASILYEQLIPYRSDLELSWQDLHEWEERFEAHIDALIIGGNDAMWICKESIQELDAGMLHVATRIFCRHRQKDHVMELFSKLDEEDEYSLTAVAHALRHEMPSDWRDSVGKIIGSVSDRQAGVWAHVSGFRRMELGREFLKRGSTQDSFYLGNLAWALGRLSAHDGNQVIRDVLQHDHDQNKETAAVSLLRLGDQKNLSQSMLTAQLNVWPRRAMGIGGSKQAVSILLDILRGKNADVNGVLALGLLGDLSAVKPLLDVLENQELGEAAAIALNTITGAGMSAEVFVREEFDPDELFDDEIEQYKKTGVVPVRGDGKPYGSWEIRPLCDPEIWTQWLHSNKARFDRSLRWREGLPYGPKALVDGLAKSTTPNVVRAAAYEELVIRYGMEIPFEYDLTVRQQSRFINAMKSWAATIESNYVSGKWYFNKAMQ